MEKPIFIIGCPRSGTTILMDLLCAHESFAWVSNLLNIFPDKLFLNYYNRVYDIPFVGRFLYLRIRKNKRRKLGILPKPKEAWKFWNTYLLNFQWPRGGKVPLRRRTASDITSEEITNIRNIIKILCRYGGKKRFISKYTDFPRIRYLTQAFPDAQFIHILRDGRAVAHSHCNRMLAGEFHNWQEREWWMRGWPSTFRRDWSEKYASPLAFSAYLYKFFLKEILKDSHFLPDNQYVEIKYEDLMRAPKDVLRYILEKCGLTLSPRFEWITSHVELKNMNYKWKRELEEQQKKVLDEILFENECRNFFDE